MNRQDYDREQESRDALASKLRNYAAGPWYPMHMPGHKRRLSSVPGLPVSLDFTEVPGTDDLLRDVADLFFMKCLLRTHKLGKLASHDNFIELSDI